MNLPGGEPWNFPGAGLWSIPPERVARIRLTGVCLDHGLPTPRPKMPYALRPIDQVAARPEVAAICILLGRGEIDQVTAQLAAWHFHSETGDCPNVTVPGPSPSPAAEKTTRAAEPRTVP